MGLSGENRTSFSAVLNGKELANAVRIASLSAARPSRSTMPPVFQRLLLRAADGILEVIGFDGASAARMRVPILEGEGSGAAHVHSRGFAAMVRAANQGATVQIELRVAQHRATVLFGRRRVTTNAGAEDVYPQLLSAPTGPRLVVPRRPLLALLRDSVRFAAKEDMRRLHAVFLDSLPGNGRLRAFSTNGHALGVFEVDANDRTGAIESVISPRSALLAAKTIGRSSGGDVEIVADENSVSFCSGNSRFIAKQTHQTQPIWKDLVDVGGHHSIELSRSDLVSAIKLCLQMRPHDCAPMRFLGDGRTMRLSSDKDPDLGACYEDELPYEGASCSFALSPVLLDGAIRALDGPSVKILIRGEREPVQLRSERATVLIMPVV